MTQIEAHVSRLKNDMEKEMQKEILKVRNEKDSAINQVKMEA